MKEKMQAFTDMKTREWKDNGAEQYGMSGFYESNIVKPQMRGYDDMYKSFSRGDTKVPSSMEGETRNEQAGP